MTKTNYESSMVEHMSSSNVRFRDKESYHTQIIEMKVHAYSHHKGFYFYGNLELSN